jgi:AraC-like DNA-binding protein
VSALVSDELFHRVLRARERVYDAFDEPMTVAALARTACLSPFHFLRVYTAAFGETPGRHLSRVRIERARDLLAGGASVTEACFAVGFSSLGSFSTRFAREMGVTPREFQRAARRVSVVPGELVSVYLPFCFAEHFAPEEARRIAIQEKFGPASHGTPSSVRRGGVAAAGKQGESQ